MDNTTISDPARWWRRLCWATEQVALTGDLPTDRPAAALAQLGEWVAAGVTDIIDVRGECDDEGFVARHAPHITYHWLGTDDDGGGQPDEWFASGVAAAIEALRHPDRKVVVHCHMGVNRGPSMGLAILVALGHDPIEALENIRASRPIAGIIYGENAVAWWHRTQGTSETLAYAERRRVRRWLHDNPVDIGWVISRIRRAEAS